MAILHTSAAIDSRILAIESALVETARLVSETQPSLLEHDEDIIDLQARWIELRSARINARQANQLQEAIDISKEINKVVRAMSRHRQKKKIDKILREFRGLKYIKSIKSNHKKHVIAAMRTSEGEVVMSRAEIANVFADFYEQLYKASGSDIAWTICDGTSAGAVVVLPFTVKELSNESSKIANRKAAENQ